VALLIHSDFDIMPTMM